MNIFDTKVYKDTRETTSPGKTGKITSWYSWREFEVMILVFTVHKFMQMVTTPRVWYEKTKGTLFPLLFPVPLVVLSPQGRELHILSSYSLLFVFGLNKSYYSYNFKLGGQQVRWWLLQIAFCISTSFHHFCPEYLFLYLITF
jgi:hypothetical protein